MSYVLVREGTFRLIINLDPSFSLEHQSLECPRCGSTVLLHQLDPEAPFHLVANCPDCKGWFLVEFASEGEGAVVIGLPGGTEMREAIVRAYRTSFPGLTPFFEGLAETT